MRTMIEKNLFSRLLVLLLAGGLVGCSEKGLLNLSKEKTPDFEKSAPDNPVIQVIAIWQLADGEGLEGKTTRGFAGQLFFMTQHRSAPSITDGTVRIYLFDDQGTEEQQVLPIHQFDFVPDAWKSHLYRHPLGAAYRVFVPYTRPGYHKASCSLRVRYTPPPGQGPAIHSEMVSLQLPGSSTPLPGATTTPAAPALSVAPPAPVTPAAPPAVSAAPTGITPVAHLAEVPVTETLSKVEHAVVFEERPARQLVTPANDAVDNVAVEVAPRNVAQLPSGGHPLDEAAQAAVPAESPARLDGGHPLADLSGPASPMPERGARFTDIRDAPVRQVTGTGSHPLADSAHPAAPVATAAATSPPRTRLETFTIEMPQRGMNQFQPQR